MVLTVQFTQMKIMQQNKIAFFGTSHTYGDCNEGVNTAPGLFKYVETPWPELFAKELGKDFYNFGIGGSDNMVILDTVLEAFDRGIMDEVDTVILEPRLQFDTVKLPYQHIGYKKIDEDEDDGPSTHWIEHARHTKVDNPRVPSPLTEKFWCRFALNDLKDPALFQRRIDGIYTGPEHQKTMEDKDIRKYVELEKLFLTETKYLQWLNFQFIKNVYQLCKANGIKFYWLNWEGFSWESFKPFFESDNHLMELNLTQDKCVRTYMDQDVPGNIKDWECSCGHFNQKAQFYIAKYLTREYDKRTNN